MSALDKIQEFAPWLKLRQAYRAVFKESPAQNIVLADLAKFCRAASGTTVVSPVTRQVDEGASARLEGRREVWNRISQNLRMTDRDIYRIVEQQQLQDNETE